MIDDDEETEIRITCYDDENEHHDSEYGYGETSRRSLLLFACPAIKYENNAAYPCLSLLPSSVPPTILVPSSFKMGTLEAGLTAVTSASCKSCGLSS